MNELLARADFETHQGNKAGYGEIAEELALLVKTQETEYNTKACAELLKLLTDVLSVISPEIYEHYRRIRDLLKECTGLFIRMEKLEMTYFPEETLKTDVTGRDFEAYHTAGTAITDACRRGFLLPEKYEVLGSCLTDCA